MPRIRADGDDVTTTIPPVTCAAPGCKRRAARYVEVEYQGSADYFFVCPACLTDMRNDPQGTTITVRPMPAPAPAPPPAPIARPDPLDLPRPLSSWTRTTIRNDHGLTRAGLTVLRQWQSSPRTVHTVASLTQIHTLTNWSIRQALIGLKRAGFASAKPKSNHNAPTLYTLTPAGVGAR